MAREMQHERLFTFSTEVSFDASQDCVEDGGRTIGLSLYVVVVLGDCEWLDIGWVTIAAMLRG